MQVERSAGEGQPDPVRSGERVSNTWATYPRLWNNSRKRVLMPDTLVMSHGATRKAPTVWDGPAAYQLVGGVMAYQGDDG